MKEYVQSTKEVPQGSLKHLSDHLKLVGKCVGGYKTGNEAKRLAYIRPILIVVCSLFDDADGVKLSFEDDLIGINVRATGNFEFVIQRGEKRICIVEAKKHDIDKGLAQLLIGCEVASDIEKKHIVYGIVTTLSDWTFLRSCDDIIEKHEITMIVRNDENLQRKLLEKYTPCYTMINWCDNFAQGRYRTFSIRPFLIV